MDEHLGSGGLDSPSVILLDRPLAIRTRLRGPRDRLLAQILIALRLSSLVSLLLSFLFGGTPRLLGLLSPLPFQSQPLLPLRPLNLGAALGLFPLALLGQTLGELAVGLLLRDPGLALVLLLRPNTLVLHLEPRAERLRFQQGLVVLVARHGFVPGHPVGEARPVAAGDACDDGLPRARVVDLAALTARGDAGEEVGDGREGFGCYARRVSRRGGGR